MASLSAKSGVTENTLLAIEKGRGNPRLDTLEALSRTLGVPLAALFGIDTGQRISAEYASDAAFTGLKQLIKGKQTRDAAQMMSARGKATRLDQAALRELIEAAPDELLVEAIFAVLHEFASVEPERRAATLAVLFGNPSISEPYLRRSKPQAARTKR